MEQQQVRLERLGAGRIRYDVPEQPRDRLEQHELVAVRRRRSRLPQRVADGWEPLSRDFAEDQAERCGSH